MQNTKALQALVHQKPKNEMEYYEKITMYAANIIFGNFYEHARVRTRKCKFWTGIAS